MKKAEAIRQVVESKSKRRNVYIIHVWLENGDYMPLGTGIEYTKKDARGYTNYWHSKGYTTVIEGPFKRVKGKVKVL
jgi:hypothetical protein